MVNKSPREGPRNDIKYPEFVASGYPETLSAETLPPVQQVHALEQVPVGTKTASSQAATSGMSQSSHARSSIAKPPLPVHDEAEGIPQTALRSIFPQYNPALPLDRQEYYPMQQSPTHIPHEIISRQPYSPSGVDGGKSPPPLRSPSHDERHQQHGYHAESQSQAGPSSSAVAGISENRSSHGHSESTPLPHRRLFEQDPDPDISGIDELKGLWKVANGWKASASEGRSYVLRIQAERDAPVFNLLAANDQPFYNLRMDPRATSAYITLSRRDPSRPYKPPKNKGSKAPSPGGLTSPASPAPSTPTSPPVKTSGKGWVDALTTTLEEPERKLPPNDGLIALLYPLQAAKMALDRPNDEMTVMTAERECGRLVYDPDSGFNYLVHPALATPFRVAIERYAAQCRTEYILEHVESPRHLARLVRDGMGGGFLDLDTSVATLVDAAFVTDIAVTALLLIANEDEKERKIEMFEPPPPPAAYIREGRRSSSRLSTSSRRSRREDGRAASASGTRRKFESFEMDIESQASSLAKMALDDDKLPRIVRVIIKLITWFLKMILWMFVMMFKTLTAVLKGLNKCCGER